MDHFLQPVDELSALINRKATLLFKDMSNLEVHTLGLPPTPLKYYVERHHQRRFFSVQTAAELLYRSIGLKNKPVNELVIMDYGAGMGTLYLLAKMIGCKTVIYNDILEEMGTAAQIISQHFCMDIDHFIVGDHNHTLQQLEQAGVICDIVLSRNVVEHIYDLDDFYGKMAQYQPSAVIFFSTTANFRNPAMLWYHKRVHKRYEEQYKPKRKAIIRQQLPDLEATEAEQLAIATRGLAMGDLDNAIATYASSKVLPNPNLHYSNTCDPENGLWAEHIIPPIAYKQILNKHGYACAIHPAFWDTHYGNTVKNIFGRSMNVLTRALGKKKGLKTTAFIYIIAQKK